MHTSKLFQTLVVGGALLASGNCSSPEKAVSKTDPQVKETAPATKSSSSKKQLMFCEPKNSNTCKEGNPLANVECCWNTSC